MLPIEGHTALFSRAYKKVQYLERYLQHSVLAKRKAMNENRKKRGKREKLPGNSL